MTAIQTRRSTPPVIISRSDTEVLSSILRYHCLTATQVAKLRGSPKSLVFIQKKLKRLYEAGYLERDRIPTRPTEGSAPLYYALGRKGLVHLAGVGVAVPERAKPYQVHEYSYLFLAHLLAVNEFLIGAELLCRRHPQLKLARLLHDQTLKRQPVYVPDGSGKRRAVVPDGFLDFEDHANQRRRPLCLELDRGTERQKDFREKIRALVAFGRGPYQQAFGRQSLTICLVASPGRDRLLKLVEWTRQELSDLKAGDETADLFRLAAFPLDWHIPEAQRPTPAELFLAKRWYTPFDPTPVPLFSGIA